jgi:two-component system phosphate regulon sensor histidine kinase PhoR
LRTPLTAIRSYIATIFRDPNMPEETKHKFLTVIDVESARLQKLIEGLLELSRIESGTAEITMRPVSVAAVINQAIQSFQPAIQQKDIRLTTDIQPDLGDFCCDETRFRSMVTNLLDNAIKFTAGAGCVSISAKHCDRRLVIRVSDTGIGIPTNALPRIFDRFYRVSGPDTQISGAGLGLAIVKEVVDMHSGHIEVESEPGKGSTFTVYLPVRPQDTQAQPRE